jgi:hypothetical protein
LERKIWTGGVVTESNISDRVVKKVGELFAPSKHEDVYALLREYRMGEQKEGTERIHLDILQLSGGSIEKVEQLVKLANTDSRDVIMAAEYDLRDGKYVKKVPPNS